MTDAFSTPVPDRPADERVSVRSAVLAPWLLLGIGLAGVTSRDSQPIASRAFEIVKEDLTQRFGGVTAHTRSPAEGRWRADRTHIEDVVAFEVLCNDLDRHWWNAYRQRLENDFRQQSVVIRAEPALLF